MNRPVNLSSEKWPNASSRKLFPNYFWVGQERVWNQTTKDANPPSLLLSQLR